MATTSEVKYLGELRTQATHLRSGEQILTDAPTDNNGKGEAFSPTDLVATSLLSCMLTIMGIQAEKKGYKMGEVSGTVEKIMADAPRRISRINIELTFRRQDLSAMERKHLETAAMNCPVAKSISPDIQQKVKFLYD